MGSASNENEASSSICSGEGEAAAAAREEDLGPVPPEVLQFESQVVPGLGEHGKGAPIGDHNEVGNSSLKGRLTDSRLY